MAVLPPGFNHEKLTYRYVGREFRLTDVYGNVVRDVIAWGLLEPARSSLPPRSLEAIMMVMVVGFLAASPQSLQRVYAMTSSSVCIHLLRKD